MKHLYIVKNITSGEANSPAVNRIDGTIGGDTYSLLKKDYVVEYINYSKENKNLDALKRLEFPQRFGFPVLVIIDRNGKRIHTQNSVYLEQGRGYSKDKVMSFLNSWKPSALDPK